MSAPLPVSRRLLRVALALSAVAVLAASAGRARASTEEFSTFNVLAQEEDDESVIDHLLTGTPASWDPEWDRAVNGLRTSQGCLTSGQWFIDTRLKLETSMGDRARFGLAYTDHQSDEASYTNTDLLFHWPAARGRITAMFRPYHDKSRQDFGLGWGIGADSAMVNLQTMFVFEDMFNNLWAWRQTRVGGESEPYTRHPYEPNLSFALRGKRVRFRLESRYLMPSVKRVIDPADPGSYRVQLLWGTLADATLEADAWGATWQLAVYDKQARGVQDADALDGSGEDFRRQWWVRGGFDRALGARTLLRWRWTYMDRAEDLTPPLGDGRFHGVDRVQHLELRHDVGSTVTWRVGWMHDHVNIGAGPGVPGFTWGTRGENRLYVGLDLRFSKVRTTGIEGIELDREPYEVTHHHDKGFLSLQSLF